MSTIEITRVEDVREGDVVTLAYNGHEFTGPAYWDGAPDNRVLRIGPLILYGNGRRVLGASPFVRATREADGCSVEDCENGRDGRNRMCSGHRNRVKVHGDPQADRPLRKMGSGGVKRHPLYITWKGIKARVYDASSPSFHNYGGRGISMAPEWVNDSRAFLDWVDANLGPRPDGYSLDRIDNDGDYEPGNLRWASASQQQFNTRKDGSEGIVRRPNGRFQVWIKRDGERLTVGTFDTFEEAVEARQSAMVPDLPTEAGSVIVNATIRGVSGLTAILDLDGVARNWLVVGHPLCQFALDEDITAWTPARTVAEDGAS